MTRAWTIAVCLCVLAAGAAAAGIFGRDLLQQRAEVTIDATLAEAAPVSNSLSKQDKLPLAAAMLAALSPQDGLRKAVGPEAGTFPDLQANAPIAIPPEPLARPKSAPKIVQKDYSLLSDAQITALKGRLNLTAQQEAHWPAVENALRNVARKIHSNRQTKRPAANAPPINPDDIEVQQLKAAAMPLLFQLREDQKREVRALARIIGLNQVASQI